jgi:hypothetical protein
MYNKHNAIIVLSERIGSVHNGKECINQLSTNIYIVRLDRLDPVRDTVRTARECSRATGPSQQREMWIHRITMDITCYLDSVPRNGTHSGFVKDIKLEGGRIPWAPDLMVVNLRCREKIKVVCGSAGIIAGDCFAVVMTFAERRKVGNEQRAHPFVMSTTSRLADETTGLSMCCRR